MKKIPDIEIAKKMINLQQSATSRGFEFDLSFDTVKHLMTRTHCYYTNTEFEDEGKLSLSIDRVDTKKGYIEGNVVSCTQEINNKKCNLTMEEIQSLASKISEFLSRKEKPIKAQITKKPKRSKKPFKVEETALVRLEPESTNEN